MIITQTPFRMSFFGGGTDMESFFRENGGAVLSTTFDKYCYVNVRHLPRFFDYSTELSYSKTERVTCIEDIQHPAIRNAMKMLDIFSYPTLMQPVRALQSTGKSKACFTWHYAFSRSSWANTIQILSIALPIGVEVSNFSVQDTNSTLYCLNSSMSFAKSTMERLIRSSL